MENQLKYLFVINPISGGQSKNEIIAFLKRKCNLANAPFFIMETQGQNDHITIKEHYIRHKPEITVAVGGDGTFHQVCMALKNLNATIALFPCGSANGMATELKLIPDTRLLYLDSDEEIWEQVWATISNENKKQIDCVQLQDNYFSLHLADIGLNAKIVRDFQKNKITRGISGYARHFIKNLHDAEKFAYKITTENIVEEGEAYMIVIANSRKYGTGALINPKGNICDGIAELCIIKEFSMANMLTAFVSIFKNDAHYEENDLEIIPFKQAKINLLTNETLQIDGEIIGDFNRVLLQVLPAAFSVIC